MAHDRGHESSRESALTCTHEPAVILFRGGGYARPTSAVNKGFGPPRPPPQWNGGASSQGKGPSLRIGEAAYGGHIPSDAVCSFASQQRLRTVEMSSGERRNTAITPARLYRCV